MKVQEITPLDVEHFPEILEEGVLYICEAFELAGHKCCCGCGEEVITPLNPSRWRLYRNGQFVTLIPSIGNWKFDCRSHYWIQNNQIIPSYDFTEDEVTEVLADDARDRERYLSRASKGPNTTDPDSPSRIGAWLRRYFTGR